MTTEDKINLFASKIGKYIVYFEESGDIRIDDKLSLEELKELIKKIEERD